MYKFVFAMLLIAVLTACSATDSTSAENNHIISEETSTPTYDEPTEIEITAPTLVTPEQARDMIANENVILLDVRTLEEFDAGHIENALHIPLDRINEAPDHINRNATILVYCRTGVRSNQAAWLLIDMGFTTIYDLMGGIVAWYASK